MATPRVKPEDRKKRGRPTEYKSEYAHQAFKFALLGVDDIGLARLFEVAPATLYKWKKKYPEFVEALKNGKERADATVADKLRNRAEGYEWDEVQPIKVKHVKYKDGKRVSEIEKVEHIVVHRVVPPDPTSAIFWLKNRQKEYWRDKHEVDNTGEVTHKWEEMDDEQLDRAIQARKDRVSGAFGGTGASPTSQSS